MPATSDLPVIPDARTWERIVAVVNYIEPFLRGGLSPFRRRWPIVDSEMNFGWFDMAGECQPYGRAQAVYLIRNDGNWTATPDNRQETMENFFGWTIPVNVRVIAIQAYIDEVSGNWIWNPIAADCPEEEEPAPPPP